MEKDTKIQSVARAIAIIEALAEVRGELPLNEIAHRLGLAKSTVHGIISTLKDHGYIEQSSFTGKYRLGLRLFEVGSLIARNWEVRTVAAPYIQRLKEEMGETIHLVVLDKYEVLYIDKLESSESLRIASQVGMRLPAHCTGVGKVLLAHLPAEERAEVLETKGLARYTRNTITDAERLEAELARIREEGYAVDNEEIMDSLRCVAAPIQDQTGRVVSAISLSGPVFRMRGERFERAVELVTRTAREISAELGYREKRDRAGKKVVESGRGRPADSS